MIWKTFSGDRSIRWQHCGMINPLSLFSKYGPVSAPDDLKIEHVFADLLHQSAHRCSLYIRNLVNCHTPFHTVRGLLAQKEIRSDKQRRRCNRLGRELISGARVGMETINQKGLRRPVRILVEMRTRTLVNKCDIVGRVLLGIVCGLRCIALRAQRQL